MTLKPVDTAIIMIVGPIIDDTDFKSLEEAIAYDAAGMDVSLIVEKTDGTTAVTAITLTTGGTSDWTHKDGGYYEIEVTAAQNTEKGIAYLRGVCDGVLPFESPRYEIVATSMYDSFDTVSDTLDAIKGTGWVQTSHSLAERPTGAGGGGGHCAWYDDDLARAAKFFKTFPTDFEKFVNDSTKVSTDTSRKQIDSELNNETKLSKILSHMTAMQSIMDSLQSAQKTTDAVILEIASETALEAALDGFEED